eukprot:403353331
MYGQPFRLTFKGQNKLGFDIAFGGYEDIDPKYGAVKVVKTTKIRQYNEVSGQFDQIFTTQDVELVKCKYSDFNYPRKNESAYQDVSILLCIKDKSFLRIGGAWTTNRLEYLDICLQPCQNTTTSKKCASKKQQDEFFSMVDFQLRFVNQYFDFADMNNPVKSFIEDRYFIPVIPDQQKGMDIFIKKAQGKLYDNFIPFVPQQELKFALVDNFRMYTARLDYYGKCLAKFTLRMDLESDLYTRQVYTISDMLSDLGGIYSSLFALGAILVGVLSENQFYYKLIKEVYQARPSKTTNISQDTKNQVQGNLNNPSQSRSKNTRTTFAKKLRNTSLKSVAEDSQGDNDNFFQSIQLNRNIEKCYKKVVSINPNQSIINDSKAQTKKNIFFPQRQDETMVDNTLDQTENRLMESPIKLFLDKNNQSLLGSQNKQSSSLIENLFQEINNRINFKFSFKEILRTSFTYISKKTLDEKRNEDKYRKIFLFKKGVKKINNEFDAISLMKLMKQVKLLTSIILNPTQKILLGFSKKNVLDSENSQNESEEDDVKIVKRLKSENNFIKLMALIKVKKNLSEYFHSDRKFKAVDERLINGILTKNNHGDQQYTLKSHNQADLLESKDRKTPFVIKSSDVPQISKNKGLFDKLTFGEQIFNETSGKNASDQNQFRFSDPQQNRKNKQIQNTQSNQYETNYYGAITTQDDIIRQNFIAKSQLRNNQASKVTRKLQSQNINEEFFNESDSNTIRYPLFNKNANLLSYGHKDSDSKLQSESPYLSNQNQEYNSNSNLQMTEEQLNEEIIQREFAYLEQSQGIEPQIEIQSALFKDNLKNIMKQRSSFSKVRNSSQNNNNISPEQYPKGAQSQIPKNNVTKMSLIIKSQDSFSQDLQINEQENLDLKFQQ